MMKSATSSLFRRATAAQRPSTTATAAKALFSTSTSGFDTVGCVGLGLMGHGICQVAAQSGVHSKIIAYEKEERFLEAG